MIWVAWRQQRVQILASVGLVALVAVALVVARFAVVSDLAAIGLAGCWQAEDCYAEELETVIQRYRSLNATYEFLGMVLPALLGVFTGAAMFAREIEQGAHIFSLTQSISRTRWWITKALVGGLPVVAAMTGLGLLASWARAPIDWIEGRMFSPRFEIEGLTPGVYTLLAVSVGAVLGLWLRNTLAAMAVTLAVYAAVIGGLAATPVRNHYAAPVRYVERVVSTPSFPLGDGVLIDSGYFNRDGDLVEPAYHECILEAYRTGQVIDRSDLVQRCLRESGAETYVLVYHPADRYWRFQATEAGIVGVLSAAALSTAALAVRRRLW